MTYSEALDWLEQVGRGGSRLGLDRVRAYLTRLGAPQDQIPMIHVAGTNGKGSVSACLSAILTQAGYRVGLYTSPHLDRFNERFRIRGEEISDAAFADLVSQGRAVWETMEDKPTEFEVITALAFLYFAQSACDLVVLEVGLGGRLDATNVIPAPEVAVLTNIGLDHTKVLGNTVEAIAATKAGIIKPGCHAVLYPCAPSVQEVVAVRCRAAGAPLTVADFDALSSVCDTLEGQIFNYGPYKGLRLPLLGGHQLRNAAVALTTIDVLRQRGWHIDESAVRQGLAQTAWPGRFQVVRRQPTIILDGGHNPQCMVSLAAAIREYLPGQPVTVLTGVLADKDYGKMYDQLAPLAARFITVTPHNPRALDAGELAAFLRRYGKPVTACDTIREGVSRMLADTPPDGTAVCCGSLYLLGDVVQSLEKV